MEVVSMDAIRAVIEPYELIEPMREAFIQFSAGRTSISASVLDLGGGDVHIKSAYTSGGQFYVVKLASWMPANAGRGLPVSDGVILVCCAHTGTPVALLRDGHYLTDARTAAAGVLATVRLGPSDAAVVGVLGAGTQARWQLVTLYRARAFERAIIWSRRTPAARRLAIELTTQLGVEVSFAGQPRTVVEECDVLITATASREPLVQGRWLRPGQHITAIGADDATKRELDDACFARADRLIVDSVELTSVPAGTYRVHGELGGVLSGRVAGRQKATDITIAQLTGIAAQDLVAAQMVLERLGILG